MTTPQPKSKNQIENFKSRWAWEYYVRTLPHRESTIGRYAAEPNCLKVGTFTSIPPPQSSIQIDTTRIFD